MTFPIHPQKFEVQRINELDKHAYMATAFSFRDGDGEESVLLGPSLIPAYQKACELYGDQLRMDLAQEVVVLNKVTFAALMAHAGLTSQAVVPAATASNPTQQRLEPVKKVGRRRRQIFQESEGKCHYCACALELDGKWHVEHKMPRALGGDDEPTNLVAACVPCNVKKRDRTDLEFIALLKSESGGP